uniref:TNase-like domain-containing protein n=1 Tax=Grammatophora oceanica TaxID=210454 RepID=A0A7S1V294_9STRA|eukprot:CAMPEP_0194032268 /NCGR_PEP_ID=MMETSP0009_2-20130614/5246_1 /TAXON_ID=210454 /ORGANISM="Grammatophora oceanica, Strain CCMP 410" /LENGTH=935 /DNA_ID=CAMNT_0038672653 /DNA_START=58 /DNA_END=2865 /DNA_ORIENTATION=+
MSAPAAAAPLRPVLPLHGVARVKNVLSGDTVVLLGKQVNGGKPPEVVFTFEKCSSPRIASKGNGHIDEPGAFPAREWLRTMVVGKNVAFETRKQGATAGDRVYGLLFLVNAAGQRTNLAVECVKLGHAIPKIYEQKEGEPERDAEDPAVIYETALKEALQEAQRNQAGVHAESPALVRKIKNAGDDFQVLQLTETVPKVTANGRCKCVIEYVFDGSRYRCHVVDPQLGDLQYSSFTLLLAGVNSPRLGNTRGETPVPPEPFSDTARSFVETRLLQRELEITLHGTDKAGVCAVGTIHHPRGNIAVELLKNGLGKMSDWSVRMMNPMDVPALRIAENGAKRTNTGVWHNYAPPQLSGASEIIGQVIEVQSGDTLMVLPAGQAYDSEAKLKKISLASIRAPRVGNERMGRADEPYAHECKERLRVLCAGKQAKIQVNYERDIPMGESSEKRQFGSVSVGKRPDISEVLVSEGLATTQRHREDDEKSPRYDELVAAEAVAKSNKKGLHSGKPSKKGSINDLSDPRKAKAYSGSLIRGGNLRGIVEYVFNGARFKVYIPAENCYVVFAPNYIRCPQPSPTPGARPGTRPAEPFGDESKRHARLSVLQRTVELSCTGVTNGGVMVGSMFIGQGGQRRDYALELVGAGLATVDQRKIDYGEAPKSIVDAQTAAKANKVGIWSIAQPEPKAEAPVSTAKSAEQSVSIRLCEIRSGNHFFFRVVGDEAGKVMDESMVTFTQKNGTSGAPCDVKIGKAVAALFNDGSGKSWYRAKIVERRGAGKVAVLFVDHGNIAVVNTASQLRPLDMSLGTERVPAVAKEATLALTITRPVEEDEGLEAAHMLQSMAWGKDMTARVYGTVEGKMAVSLLDGDKKSVNETLVSDGLARVAKKAAVDALVSRMVDGNSVVKLAAELNVAQEAARKTRSGMWRYGDVGDDDDDYE